MASEPKKLGTAKLLFNCATSMGLEPTWVTPGGLFVITTSKGEQYFNGEFSNLNSQVSSSLARNKYLTRLILERNGMPNIPYLRPKSLEEAITFLELHQKIIVKPLHGAGATDIHIVDTIEQLTALNLPGKILEKYILGKEIRYLVLNDSVIAVHESKYGISVDQHRDLERVSYDVDTWDPVQTKMSLDISRVLDLPFAAVDYLIDQEKNYYVLEVNSAPGFKWFHAPSEGPPVDLAAMFLTASLK